MSEIPLKEIVRKLADNAADISAVCADAQPERLSMLAHRQKSLTGALGDVSLQSAGVSSAEVKALQHLVERAMETVKAEMCLNRGSMQVTGIKKKVLGAYGTVTASNPPSG